MPQMSEVPGLDYAKLLFMGDSGTGKTGALAALVNAGYKLLLLDFDAGHPILANYVKPANFPLVHYEVLTDKMTSAEGKAVPQGTPKAWSRGMDILTRGVLSDGKGGDLKLGDPAAFGPGWVVVIDSLDRAARSAYNWHLHLSSGNPRTDPRNIYFEAQNRVIGMLALINSAAFATNVIVIAHIDYVDDLETFTQNDKGEPQFNQRGRPKSIGKAIATDIPGYFNTVVRAKSIGSGAMTRRVIRTQSEGIVDLKSAMPSRLPAELPIESGLLTIFQTLTKPPSA